MCIKSSIRDRASRLDREDKLSHFLKEFECSDKATIYLDGNSLGKLPNRSRERVIEVLDNEWQQGLIRSWNSSWWEMPERSAQKISTLIGADDSEVMVADSTSVNLYKLIKSAMLINPGKKKIVSEELSFPTDLYIIQGILDDMGSDYSLELAKSHNNISVDFNELDRMVDNDTALVVLSLVSFRSAAMYDMKKINDLIHSKGALILWDLCHATGAIPVDLSGTGSDMAVGCTYKYLNCGPGSPSYLYLNKKYIKDSKSPIWGWFGEQNPFDFNSIYQASDSIKKFKTGTSAILSMCTLEPSLDIIIEAGIDNIRQKNIGLTSFFIEMYNSNLRSRDFGLGSPANSKERGSHISLNHTEAYRISKALLDPECGNYTVIPDYRPPDNLRFGFSALYNTYQEVLNTVEELILIVDKDLYLNYSHKRENVT